MHAANEFSPPELLGAAGALWLDKIGAFEGVVAAFATQKTLHEGAAGGFRGPVREEGGRLREEYVARLCATLGFPYGRLATCRQAHGTRVYRVEVAERRWYEASDGLATSVVEVPLAVFAADCLPVIMWAPREGALALLHAGWRGTLGKIVAGGVSLLRDEWEARPEEVEVFLGPAVGPCCYEVGDGVASAAEAAFGKRRGQVLTEDKGGVRRLDLYRANELVAQEAGVPPGNIYRVATCTSCEAELFPSHRREGEAAGRFIAIASLKAGGSAAEEDAL